MEKVFQKMSDFFSNIGKIKSRISYRRQRF